MSTTRSRLGTIRESETDQKLETYDHGLPPRLQRREEIRLKSKRVRSIGVSGVGNLISAAPESASTGQKLMTKLLLNVTIERSLGPVQVVTSSEKTVEELIKAALQIYLKEKRRPLLNETDPQLFELHYSQFSFESLNPEEKLISLGSRNFFLCLKPSTSAGTVNSFSCSNQAANKSSSKSPFIWTRFMDFLL